MPRMPLCGTCLLLVRAQKNNVVDYLDDLEPEKRKKLIEFTVPLARKRRQENRKKDVQIKAEISKRLANKLQKKKTQERNKLERLLRTCDIGKVSIKEQIEFEDLDESVLQSVNDILAGKIVGHYMCHLWYDEDSLEKTVYHAKVEKLLKKNGGTYRIGYWEENETYDNAEDYDISKYALAVDLICEDLVIS
ncbi:hypothetical protein SNE40_007851 [Patella caerulea]|uniref:Uncharacterized protein n=1 Tax=Patella caerulea TaxID=87958 RepID=A0AAN8Q918_PATCE